MKKLDLVLRQEHRAGEKMFVDYAGATIPIHDPESGEVHPAAVFVAVLGASSYTFAEATTGQDLRNWIGSHMRAFEFFGGVAEVVVPDNLKSAVTHPSYYEPDLNPTYRDLGEHYGVAIIPARPYRARDKAKAEVGVQVVQRWIVAALRKRKFFSLEEVNQAIAELLVRLNQRPFRKREGSRATLFAQLDRPALKPLPATRYQFGEWEDRPRQHRLSHRSRAALLQRAVRAGAPGGGRAPDGGDRGSPPSRGARGFPCPLLRGRKATTLTEHMPKAHQKYLGRTPSRLIEEAQQTGPCTGQLVEAILAAKRHPEQGFRSCLGILRLAKTYPAERMEAAARRCLRARAYNFQSMDSILKNQLDRLPLPGDPPAQTCRGPRQHPRRRLLRFPAGGRSSGNSVDHKENHAQPTNDREIVRHAHARHGRCFYSTTGRSADRRNSSFEERFALLVDRQWNWRQNRALERRLRDGRLQGPACIEDIDFRAARGLDKQVVRR